MAAAPLTAGSVPAHGLGQLQGHWSQSQQAAQPMMQQSQPSFLDRIVQEVPSAAAFAAPPPSPPPLKVNGPGAFSSGRAARAKAREARAESPGPLSQPPAAEPAPPPRDGQSRPRRAPGAFVPQPPAGRPGRPPRAGGQALAARAQRELARAAGNEPGGSLAADQAPAGGLPGGLRPQHSQLLRRSAAEKIQRVWRASHSRRTQTGSKLAKSHLCATKIQARWRCFRVVRRKHNEAATHIQRIIRGCIVRLKNSRLKAAIRMQRHARGMMVRRKLGGTVAAVTSIQCLARGFLGRRRVQARRTQHSRAALTIQRVAKCWEASKVVHELRRERDAAEVQRTAALQIQTVFRGNKGRQRFEVRREEYMALERQHTAATKLQATARRRAAEQKVDSIRSIKLEAHSRAATMIRKHWLCHLYRKRFLQLRQEYTLHEKSIVTMQRYVRGYVVRLRMWRNAIRAEEELWAAIEIQRCFRGFCGRVRWEKEYNRIHSRLESACKLQRHVRGWLARTRALRIRKRNARAEFEKARRRFKGAQRMQALVRGVQCRKRMQAFRQRKVQAVLRIQSVQRGHRLRSSMSEQVMHKRTVQIQAAMRGFLVRNRRFGVLLKVICIQTNYRKWLRFVPEAERARRAERWRVRRAEAKAAAAAAAAAA